MKKALPKTLKSIARTVGILALAIVVVSVVERFTGAHQPTTGPASLTGPDQSL
ncbi:hypothetical protein [Rhodococcus sp. IEGM 1406]|uniref:hypothetical protein n=1 Tax=Rhodococcus sp. IEGM 1406 TaxID=3047083 RepID=UPI0024B78635|nr:hypothetical protein [Rhodococcus sp. IEGM 1406]MDI9908228.1 hypothetical protein [Rhodococcus sp. IEGM 1406]